MESPTGLELGVSVLDKPPEIVEHVPKRYSEIYHGHEIRIVEFDHQASKLAGIEYQFPKDWRDKLGKEFKDSSDRLIGLEYCMPDLWKYAHLEMLAVGYDKGPDYNDRRPDHTSEVFGYLGRLAGQEGRKLVAADPANEWVYILFEGGGAEHPLTLASPAALSQHVLGNLKYGFDTFSYFDYGRINDREIDEGFIVDTRRLLTARGLMQEVLTNNQGITLFTAPVHAERVANYVRRQSEFEGNSDQKVEKPKDLGSITPKEEARKMITYGRWPLHRNVRVYSPSLSPNSYSFDLFLNDGVLAADEKKRDSTEYLRGVLDQMKTLLSNKPMTSKEKWYFKRVQVFQTLLTIFLKNPTINPKLCQKARREICSYLSTNRYGWALEEKNKIF